MQPCQRASSLQFDSTTIFAALIMLFGYLVYFGNDLLDKARSNCAQYDELGGAVRGMDCAHSITVYSITAITAYGIGAILSTFLSSRLD